MASRTASDEAYVLDLLDAVFGVACLRGHRFDWLRGDPGIKSQGVKLPVDGYWPTLNLVVEYREDQHFKPSPFFDRRATLSGVGRGEQRRIYDARRDELIPQHGLNLWVVRPHDLKVRSGDRLVRDRDADLAALRRMATERGLKIAFS